MPRIDVTVSTALPITMRMRQVCAMFDAPASEKTTRSWAGDMPIEAKPWQVGLIVGPSGSGKSQIARKLFGEEARLEWAADRSVVDCFPAGATIDDITAACSAVGFNTIPAWLRPHGTLSNGEKFRVELARLLLEQPRFAWVDEFTSVVDRVVAQAGSHAVQKYVRRDPGRRFVAVGCHYDVIDWLQPDWILEPATMAFTWRSLQRRPTIAAEIKRVTHATWGMFAPYHYLTAAMHQGATCFALHIAGRPVAFAGVLALPVSSGARAGEAIWRVSRLVTLPDWQGLGLAFALVDELGSAYAAIGARFRTYPAHPALVRSFARSKSWTQEKIAGEFRKSSRAGGGDQRGRATGAMGGRPCATFEYTGPVTMTATEARRLIARG